MARREDGRDLTPRRRISALLEGALERSPADETELVWLEQKHARTSYPGKEIERRHDTTVLVRVIDRGRIGSHRTGVVESGDLDNAVRAAIAQSRVREPVPGLPHLPSDDSPPPRLPKLRDPAVAQLSGRGIEKLMARSRQRSERARLQWCDARVAVFSSRGLRRGGHGTAPGRSGG